MDYNPVFLTVMYVKKGEKCKSQYKNVGFPTSLYCLF